MRLPDYLRRLSSPHSPRVHGNGFIQIDITRAVRLHVWGDERIPHQQVATPLHDHTFGFTSMVCTGVLLQRTFFVRPADGGGATQPLYQPHRASVRQGEDTVLRPHGQPVLVESAQDLLVPADRYRRESLRASATRWRSVRYPTGVAYADVAPGSTYTMKAGEFHETYPLVRSISVIVKDGPTLAQGGPSPTVLVPYGQQPDNSFDRHAAASFGELWRIVDDAIYEDAEAVATGILWALGVAAQEKEQQV